MWSVGRESWSQIPHPSDFGRSSDEYDIIYRKSNLIRMVRPRPRIEIPFENATHVIFIEKTNSNETYKDVKYFRRKVTSSIGNSITMKSIDTYNEKMNRIAEEDSKFLSFLEDDD